MTIEIKGINGRNFYEKIENATKEKLLQVCSLAREWGNFEVTATKGTEIFKAKYITN